MKRDRKYGKNCDTPFIECYLIRDLNFPRVKIAFETRMTASVLE